ncbi:MAG: hypothetical protein RJA10_3158 [Pseudomonadota bacterium]
MNCPKCGHENRAEARFCDACGSPLAGDAAVARAAPRSYTPAHLAQRILTLRSALEGERKQVTVLFCDIADSTPLVQRLGPEAMHGVLNRFFELALDVVHEVEGTINQFLGDGFMALFGAPLAHEDHARRALSCALALGQRLREAAAQQPGSPLAQLRLRIGINTGAVVVGTIGDNLRMDYTAVGDTTNIAARLQGQAGPGQICVSEAVRQAAAAHFEFQPLGETPLKGVAERVRVHRLVRAVPRQQTQPAPTLGVASTLVGRDPELKAAAAALTELRAGRGGVLMLVGEPGVGKSRLMAELRRLHRDDRLGWLEGRALSFGRNLSYWPFIEILRGAFGIADDEAEEAALHKLERGLSALLGERAADSLPYMATVLALRLPGALQARVGYLDGPALKRQVFVSMRQVFEALASRQPTLLLLEDWHWADPSSIELAEHLLPLTTTLPLLMFFPTRPVVDGPAQRMQRVAAEMAGARLHHIQLTALTSSASAELVDNLVGRGGLPQSLRDQVLRRAEGNPLFMEEVVRSLISDGLLARVGGRWQLTRQSERVQLPDTLHALILARIDRLDEEVKHALKLASVIGRSFFDRVLEAIVDAQSRLPDNLAELEHAELIREKRRTPEAEHIFKHALIQEAAYGSILAENRRAIHGQVAQAIEKLYADRLDEFASLLAHHYTCAEDWSKAQEYLFKAGDQAGRMASDAEALDHLRRAEAAYVKAFGDRLTPLQRATLGRKIGAALFGTGLNEPAHAQMRQALGHLGIDYPTTRDGVRREILRQLVRHVWRRVRNRLGLPAPRDLDADVAAEISTLAHTMSWVDYFVDKERMLLDCLLELYAGETSTYALAESRGTASVGFGFMTFGAHRLARRYHARAMAIGQRTGHPAAIAFSWLSQGFVDFYDGCWDEADSRLGKAAQVYRDSGDLHRWGAAALMQAFVVRARGDLVACRAVGEDLIRAGDDSADPQLVSWGLQVASYVHVDTGPLPGAEARLRRGCEVAARIPAWDNYLYQSSMLAKCLVLQGRLDEALAVVADSNRVLAREKLKLPFDRIETATAEATVRLALAERAAASGGDATLPAVLLREAQVACRAALRTARRMPRWLIEALRLQGSVDWLADRPAAAHAHWDEAIDLAERWAFPVERARTLQEVGLRTGQPALLEQAARLFRQTGALSYLPAPREPSSHHPSPPSEPLAA